MKTNNLRLAGMVGLGIQLVLGSISILLFLLTVANRYKENYLEFELGLLFTILGLICLFMGIYSVFNYNIMTRKRGELTLAKKITIKKAVNVSIVASLGGVLITFLALEIFGGIVFSKILNPELQSLFHYDPCSQPNSYRLIISSVDVFAILASANLIVAHCGGLAGSLWTLNQIEK